MEEINQKKEDNTSHKDKKALHDEKFIKLNDNISEVSRTLRMLEERYVSIRRKMQVSDQYIIDDTNKIFTKLKLIVKDIEDIKLDIVEIKEKLEIFSNEIGEMANKQDLKVIQKYIELWQPMTFLTEKQALSMIKDEIEESSLK